MGACLGGETHPIFSKYNLGPLIGKGAFSKIYEVENITRSNRGQKRALKITNLKLVDDKAREALRKEIQILESCNHEHIVNLYENYQIENKMWMVLDLCKGGALFEQIRETYQNKNTGFSERQAAKVIFQVASALKYLHALNIVHRDLKPENIMFLNKDMSLEKINVKIIDFGLAVQSEQKLHQPCGTPNYIAPEIVKNEPYHSAVDIWALGVILYFLLSGTNPFLGAYVNNQELYKSIKKAKVTFPEKHWRKVSEESKDLIQHMLQKRTQKRYTAEKILNHPWIKGNKINGADGEFGLEYYDTFRQNVTLDKLRRGVRAILTLNKLVAVWEEEQSQASRNLGHTHSSIPYNESSPETPPPHLVASQVKPSEPSTPDVDALAVTPEVPEVGKSQIVKTLNVPLGDFDDALTPSASTSVSQAYVKN